MNTTGLRLENVTLRLAGRVLISALSLTVGEGEVVTLMGESGCGKSSLLAYLCGTLPRVFEASGSISIGGEDITHRPAQARRLGILFQDDLLFPHLSVGENLLFALPRTVRNRFERRQRMERALEEVGLAGFADRDPATLSGGQRARVAVVRVLLSEPRALLLDEPFARLDLATRGRFREFVFEHLRGRNLPTLLVTHDPADAAASGGRIIELSEK